MKWALRVTKCPLNASCNNSLQPSCRPPPPQKERESFLCHHVPDGERLVSLALCPEALTTAEQVGHVRSALRRCTELLECLISREVEEMGEDMAGEYETLRKAVRDRLGHLVHSTGALLENSEGGCPPSPEMKCAEVQTLYLWKRNQNYFHVSHSLSLSLALFLFLSLCFGPLPLT